MTPGKITITAGKPTRHGSAHALEWWVSDAAGLRFGPFTPRRSARKAADLLRAGLEQWEIGKAWQVMTYGREGEQN